MTAARLDNPRGGLTGDNATRWIGIDLHRRRSQIAVVDEHGELSVSRRIVNDRETFWSCSAIPSARMWPWKATYGWEWLAELLAEAGYGLHLAHPLRTRAIAAARVKTDAIDAKTLAHLLRAGFLPEAYVAPRELRDLPELLRHRATPTRMRSAIKNRVHAIPAKHGTATAHSDLSAKAAANHSSCATRHAGAGQPDLADLRFRSRDPDHH